jgi:hypothetical protein
MLLRSVFAFGLFVLFAWPGIRWVKMVDSDHLPWWARWALGTVISFGVFSLIEAPVLLTHRSTNTAIAVGVVGWSAAALALLLLSCRFKPLSGSAPMPPPEWHLPSKTWAALALAVVVVALVLAWAFATNSVDRRFLMMSCAAITLIAIVLAFRFSRGSHVADGTVLRGMGNLFFMAALATLAFQLVVTTGCFREDADDALYMSEALSLVDSPAIGLYSAAHRGENLPATPMYALQAFELLGAMVGRISGLHTLVLFRTLLAPVLVLIAMALYTALLQRAVPRFLLGAGLLVLAYYFTFGMSSHWTTANYLLPRPAQGKTWLMHVAIPATVLLSRSWFAGPKWPTWLALAIVGMAGIGFAPTGAMILPALVFVLGLAFFSQQRSLHALGTIALLGAAAWPEVIFGLYVSSMKISSEALGSGFGGVRWRDVFLFHHLGMDQGGGAIELASIFTLPLSWAMFRRKKAALYPALFTLILFATVLNPLFFYPISNHMGDETAHRLFWLIPLSLLLASLGVVVATCGASLGGPRAALASVSALLVAFHLAGGRFVFGTNNRYLHEPADAQQCFANPFKMPSDLLEIGSTLAGKPLGPERRLLCSERVASHLDPLIPHLDFVFVRTYQTDVALLMAGRPDEAARRNYLSNQVLAGHAMFAESVALLRGSGISYVILDPPSDPEGVVRAKRIKRELTEAGFTRTYSTPTYTLWEAR